FSIQTCHEALGDNIQSSRNGFAFFLDIPIAHVQASSTNGHFCPIEQHHNQLMRTGGHYPGFHADFGVSTGAGSWAVKRITAHLILQGPTSSCRTARSSCQTAELDSCW